MAERRMFAKTIIDSDAFLDMPLSTQALYFHLSMRADDDGFINNPKKVQRMVGGSDDDLKLLVAKRFIIPFESGIVVIKHWKIHNYIRSDRYKETVYQEEKSSLTIKENGAYTTCLPPGIPNGDQMETQVRLGKDSLGKDSLVEREEPADKPPRASRFTPPTLEEVTAYCQEKGLNVDPQRFVDFYSSNGWMVGKNKMKDWRAAVRSWQARDNEGNRGGRKEIVPKWIKEQPDYNPTPDRIAKNAAELDRLLAEQEMAENPDLKDRAEQLKKRLSEKYGKAASNS